MAYSGDKDPAQFPVVDPNGLCPNYEKGEMALPEEMDTCDLCRYYLDDSGRCSKPYNK